VLQGKSKQQVNMAWNREWITTAQYDRIWRDFSHQKAAAKPDDSDVKVAS
jgi:hypothetical protein